MYEFSSESDLIISDGTKFDSKHKRKSIVSSDDDEESTRESGINQYQSFNSTIPVSRKYPCLRKVRNSIQGYVNSDYYLLLIVDFYYSFRKMLTLT